MRPHRREPPDDATRPALGRQRLDRSSTTRASRSASTSRSSPTRTASSSTSRVGVSPVAVLRPGRARRRHAAPEPHLREGRLRPLAADDLGRQRHRALPTRRADRRPAHRPRRRRLRRGATSRPSRATWQTWHAAAHRRRAGHRRAATPPTQGRSPRRHAHDRPLRRARPALPDRRRTTGRLPGHGLDGTEAASPPGSSSTSRATSARCATRSPGRDALGRVVMRYDYDMLGNRIHQSSMEAGERWMLNDVAGKPIRAWDSRGHSFRTTYDPLRRPIEQSVRAPGDPTAEPNSDPRTLDRDILVDRIDYGEPRSARRRGARSTCAPASTGTATPPARHQRAARRGGDPTRPTTSRATCCAARRQLVTRLHRRSRTGGRTRRSTPRRFAAQHALRRAQPPDPDRSPRTAA